METLLEESRNTIYHELETYCKRYFGLEFRRAVPIKRGWLNLKWKVETDKGTFLLKQYNPERLQKYNMAELRNALCHHQRLQAAGVACPRMLTRDGKIMQVTDGGFYFVVMEYCAGHNVSPGMVNPKQMYELGRQTGQMHHLLNDLNPVHGQEPQFIPPRKEKRMEYWQKAGAEAETEGKEWLAAFMELQFKATEALDFSIFGVSEGGLAHRDLWVDNILFEEDGLSAILDFDRLSYDYPKLDLARALISCSLRSDGFQMENATAFLEGYRTRRDFAKGKLVRALRLLWYMESEWWINKHMDQHSVSPARFAEEMLWLSRNHAELDAMFGDL